MWLIYDSYGIDNPTETALIIKCNTKQANTLLSDPVYKGSIGIFAVNSNTLKVRMSEHLYTKKDNLVSFDEFISGWY